MIISVFTTYILGVIAGFLASIPLGPIGVLCIQRTLSTTRKNGFISGMGAATADTIFAILALFCLTYINSFLEQYNFWVKVAGGIILIIFGASIIRKRVPRSNSLQGNRGTASKDYASNYFSVLLLTLTNPAYFFVYTMIFAALGMGSSEYNIYSDLSLLLGVLTGTNAWWFVLTFLIDKLRKRFTYRGLVQLNRIAGIAIVCFGAWAIIAVVIKLLPPIIELPGHLPV